MINDKWRDGQAGGHKALAGGQILFENLLSEIPDDPEVANQQAVAKMLEELTALFSVESDE